jgi:hypothetical protein
MMTPTAMSTTLPREINSLNSAINVFVFCSIFLLLYGLFFSSIADFRQKSIATGEISWDNRDSILKNQSLFFSGGKKAIRRILRA